MNPPATTPGRIYIDWAMTRPTYRAHCNLCPWKARQKRTNLAQAQIDSRGHQAAEHKQGSSS
jgi:hypothetical protein